jgi:hypothetical protein
LYAPPSDPPDRRAPDGLTARDVAARVKNEDIEWAVYADPHFYALASGVGGARPLNGWDNGGPVWSFSQPELVPPLLRALEDPGRFVAAHFGLRMRLDWSNWTKAERLTDDAFRCEFEHLRVELRAEAFAPGEHVSRFDCAASVDPAQLPAIRDHWHRRLDVSVMSCPWPVLVSATALPPLAWAALAARPVILRRRRIRLGLCQRCGYDLRESRGRCPECGAAVGQAV